MKLTYFFSIVLLLVTSFFFQSCTLDPCDAQVCMNGGICEDGDCDCPEGYSGESCETVWRTKMLGTYTYSESCSNFTAQASALAHSSDPLKFTFSYTDPIGLVQYELTMTGENTFELPNQVGGSNSNYYPIEGTGSIAADGKISITATVNGTTPCVFTLQP
jgi:hypothetical protein